MLKALKTFRYAGKKLRPGDLFLAKKCSDAKILTAMKKATRDLKPKKSTKIISEPVKKVETEITEASAIETTVIPTEDTVETAEPKRKRIYRRRDMTAEASNENIGMEN